MNRVNKFAVLKTRKYIAELFSLKEDRAPDQEIGAALRAGAELRGTNLWLLMLAIFVASIGLNVNSTAVIIGAMLISPLMGPIMGVGLGVGIYDTALIRSSLKNLAIAVAISLTTSFIYFSLSPLTQAQSEILARTTPTIWDVLIAFIGGFAGIIGVTRKEKSNVIPGVAIATALMPPLCTAGYGLAIGNWLYFGGAFYLFTINSVFIALSSAIFVRAIYVEENHFVDAQAAAKIKRRVLIVTFLTVVPSIYLAYQLVQDELFKSNANQFVEQTITTPKTFITKSKIDPKKRTIEVTAIGEQIKPARIAQLNDQLKQAGLPNTTLLINQQNDQEQIDMGSLKNGVLSDLYANSQAAIDKKDAKIKALQSALDEKNQLQTAIKTVPDELHALFPQITDILISDAINWNQNAGVKKEPTLVVNLKVNQNLSETDRTKISQWLSTRLHAQDVKLVVETESPARKNKSRR